MKILLTGVEHDGKRGMIGSSLKTLLESTNEITVFEGDIRTPINWMKYYNDRFDFVIHLAALAGVRTSFENPELYEDVNVNGTMQCFKFCKERNIPVLYASSSNAYEWWLNPYAMTKKATEHLAKGMGIRAIGMRFHTVWPGRDDMLFKKIERGDIEYINADHSRDYIHVDDLCSAIEAILINFNLVSKNHKVVDIGTGKAVRTIDVWNKYGSPTDSGVQLRHGTSKGERIHTAANIDYLLDLGWQPRKDIL